MKIVDVHPLFQRRLPASFPAHQKGPMIEEYAKGYFTTHAALIPDDVSYLPVFWLQHLNYHDYHKGGYDELLGLVASLADGPRYFTIIQTARMSDEVLASLKKKNCTVFSCGGLPGAVPVPLPCDPHVFRREDPPRFLASFCGSFSTHPVREQMKKEFSGKGDCYLTGGDHVSIEVFEQLMADSVFALCPRGWGPTSFRLYEAMQMGCIPVYITDKSWLPFPDQIPWGQTIVLCGLDEVDGLYDRLNTFAIEKPELVAAMAYNAKNWHATHCTYYGVCEHVMQIMKGGVDAVHA